MPAGTIVIWPYYKDGDEKTKKARKENCATNRNGNARHAINYARIDIFETTTNRAQLAMFNKELLYIIARHVEKEEVEWRYTIPVKTTKTLCVRYVTQNWFVSYVESAKRRNQRHHFPNRNK